MAQQLRITDSIATTRLTRLHKPVGVLSAKIEKLTAALLDRGGRIETIKIETWVEEERLHIAVSMKG